MKSCILRYLLIRWFATPLVGGGRGLVTTAGREGENTGDTHAAIGLVVTSSTD